MADWPRTIIPVKLTFPKFPGGLDSWGQSGKGQFRDTLEVGRQWEEAYPPLYTRAEDTKEFLATINAYWRNRTTFNIGHRYYQTQMGDGGGTPLVDGASQTGSSLDTDGWPASTTVLKAGDIISVAGVPYVLDVLEDVVSDSDGAASISISPPIFSGGSPANDAAITYTDVKFKCVLAREPNIPDSEQFIAGLRLLFREVIST